MQALTYDSVTSKGRDPWRLRTQIVGARDGLRSLAEAGVFVQSEIAKNRKPEPQVSLWANSSGFRARSPQWIAAFCMRTWRPRGSASSRLPRGRTVGFFEGAPDLAVEVLAPSEIRSDEARSCPTLQHMYISIQRELFRRVSVG